MMSIKAPPVVPCRCLHHRHYLFGSPLPDPLWPFASWHVRHSSCSRNNEKEVNAESARIEMICGSYICLTPNRPLLTVHTCLCGVSVHSKQYSKRVWPFVFPRRSLMSTVLPAMMMSKPLPSQRWQHTPGMRSRHLAFDVSSVPEIMRGGSAAAPQFQNEHEPPPPSASERSSETASCL